MTTRVGRLSGVARASSWSVLDLFIRQGGQFLVTVVLARLLTPEDFGLFAVLAVIAGTALVLTEGGVTTYLVQRPEVRDEDLGATTWVSLLASSLGILLVIVSAPVVALLLGRSDVYGMLALVAVSLPAAALGFVPMALYTRELNFRPMAVAAVAALIAGVAAALILVLVAPGPWPLVGQLAASTGTYGLVAYLLGQHRSLRRPAAGAVRPVLGRVRFVVAANLLDVASTRAYALILGGSAGLANVGIYQRADATHQLPTQFLGTIVARLALPTMAAVSSDRDRLVDRTATLIRVTMLLCVPLMGTLAALGTPMIVTLFGAQWYESGPLFSVLCLGAAMWPLNVLNVQLLLSRGDFRLFLRVEIIKKAVALVFIVLAARQGAMALATTMALYFMLAFFVNAEVTRRSVSYGPVQQLKQAWHTMVAMAAVGLPVWLLEQHWSPAPAVESFVLGCLSLGMFGVVSVIVRNPALKDVRLIMGEGRATSEGSS